MSRLLYFLVPTYSCSLICKYGYVGLDIRVDKLMPLESNIYREKFLDSDILLSII